MVSIPTQKSRPMSENALLSRFPARDLVSCLLVVTVLASGACKSTQGKKCGPESALPGSGVSWCDWEVLERSGPEPNWKNVSNAKLEFFGEGFGETEEEARENAENHMRSQVARYFETRVDSTSVVVWEGDVEKGAGRTEASTDVSVVRMAVAEAYWERRKRIGYHHGEELEDRDFRVLVKGTAPGR